MSFLLPLCRRRLSGTRMPLGEPASSLWSSTTTSAPDTICTTVREFAKKSKKNKFRRPEYHARGGSKEELPTLRASLKKLQFLVHPDRLGAYPEVQQQNQDSLSNLQGLLTSFKQLEGTYPEAAFHDISFQYELPNGEMQPIGVSLKTTGGDCRNLVQRSLGDLFEQAGINRQFTWDDGFWDVKGLDEWSYRPAEATDYEPEPPPPPPPAETLELPGGTAPQETPASSPPETSSPAPEASPSFTSTSPQNVVGSYTYPPRGGSPTSTAEEAGLPLPDLAEEARERLDRAVGGMVEVDEDGMMKMKLTQEQLDEADRARAAPAELRAAMEHLDPLLEALAAVPWLQDRRPDMCHRLTSEVVDKLQNEGWSIRGALERIWAGERDLGTLNEGLDNPSKLAVASVIGHLLKLEEQEGPAPAYPSQAASDPEESSA